MSVKEKEVKVLQEAFSQFNTTSFELERSYRLLKEEVSQLKGKLREIKREKESLREKAERNHRLAAVGEMAARMAHELRNPLCSIELFSALLQKELERTSTNPKKTEWTRHLSTAVKMMDYTITNLLLFTSKPTPELRPVDLRKVITDLLGLVSHLLEQNKIKVIEYTDRLIMPVICDEDLLRQVFLNLILNAIDAMPYGGTLEINASTGDIDKNEIIITFSDTGVGISKTDLPKIFDPFFTTKKKGSGLGLAISQNAITAHDGFIQVEKRPHRGCAFTIRLPQHPEKR